MAIDQTSGIGQPCQRCGPMAKSSLIVQTRTQDRERIRLLYVVWLETRWPLMESVCRGADRARFDLSFVLLNRATPPLAPVLDELGIPSSSRRSEEHTSELQSRQYL